MEYTIDFLKGFSNYWEFYVFFLAKCKSREEFNLTMNRLRPMYLDLLKPVSTN